MMNPNDLSRLQATALKVREHIIHMATQGGCFIGASLSCADLVVYLYDQMLQVAPDRIEDPDRDYFLLSKGHDVPALYGTLAEFGFFPKARLKNHLSPDDHIYWHPNRHIPGIEFHSGSLGHLLSVGMGIAKDIQIRGGGGRVFVLLGDGELNEGSIWEASLVAASHKLGNLVAIVDRNGFQANLPTEELNPLEPLGPKFEAFGWGVQRVSGHDFEAMDGAFKGLPKGGERPQMVIADTVRGKGLPSIEARADRWFVDFTAAEVEALIKELHGEAQAELTSEALHVR